MPVKILKNPTSIPKVDAVVKPFYPEKEGLFGDRAGKASLMETDADGSCEIRVTCPQCFRKGMLRRGYEDCVRMARKEKYRTMAIPLLLPKHWEGHEKMALHLAMEALRGAFGMESLTIYLVLPDSEEMGLAPSLRNQLTQYIEHNRRVAGDRHEASAAWKCSNQYEAAVSARTKVKAEPMLAAPSMAAPQRFARRKNKLEDIVRKVDAGFSETLLRLIDESGKKDSEIYNKANVSRQHFSKIRNNPGYRPTKPTAIAFAIALELNMEQTKDLIGRAGYTLTSSSVFDLIIMYFIENNNYNLFEINEALYEFDQSLLGT